MRQIFNPQMRLDEVSIADIKFDTRTRDDIPRLLKGLQYIYTQDALIQSVYQVLQKIIPDNVDQNNGRPGMTLWRILVLGTLRLGANLDYDRLHELVNQHMTLRQMLKHGRDDDYQYNLQTLKDNLHLLTPAVLDEINQIVVNAGHELIKKKTLTRILNGTI